MESMNDLWSSIAMWFKEKTTSPFFSVYLASFAIYNWKKFYVLFFDNGAPSSRTRLEFLNNELLPFHGTGFCSILGNWFSELIPPLLITFIVIRYFPVLQNWAHKWHTTFYFERKKIFQEAEINFQKDFSIYLDALTKVKEEQVRKARSVEELTQEINSLLEEVNELQEENEGNVEQYSFKSENSNQNSTR